MPDAISCPEYIRLQTDYEAALRSWGNLLLAQHAEPVGWDFQRAVELRMNAACERDAALQCRAQTYFNAETMWSACSSCTRKVTSA
jgi:hypothetical protein